MSSSEDSTTTEVRVPKRRRAYNDRYKRRILEELDACSELGGKGEVLRREGLYHSTISRWRRQMARTTKTAPGRPKKSALQAENEQLKRQLEEVQRRLARAETIVEVQKKLCLLLEPMSIPDSSESSR